MPRDTRGRLRAWSRCGRSWTPAGAWTAWSCEHRGSFPDALEHHHRDPPVRLALVVVIGGPDLGHQLPQPFPLRPLGRAGPGPEPDVLDLHLDLRIVAQVEVAILAEDERLGALLAAATASSREDQRGDAVPVIALLATGLAVAAHVLVPKQHRVLLAGMTGRRDATRVRGSSTAPRPPHRGERAVGFRRLAAR